MSTRSNPFKEIERFFQQMNQQFDGSSRIENGDRSLWWTEEMAIDLVDHNAEFVVTVDLPGFEKDDVDVRVTDHTLRIEADHEESTDESAQQYLRHERRHQSMYRSIHLPEEVDKQGAKARMNNGVLTVTIPKREITDAESIEIE